MSRRDEGINKIMTCLPLRNRTIFVQAWCEMLWRVFVVTFSMQMMTQEYNWQAAFHHRKYYSIPEIGLITENYLYTQSTWTSTSICNFLFYFCRCQRNAEVTGFNKRRVTIFKLINCNGLSSVSLVLPSGGVGTTKALSSTALLGSVTSTLSPADTTSSLVFPVEENNTGSMNWS